MIPKRTLTATLEISTGSMIITNRPPAFTGEADALTVSVSVLDGGAAYTPVGNVLAKLYLYWPGTINMSEAVDLTISGSTLTGSLPDTLTAVPGCPLMVIQLTDTDSGDLIVAAATPIQITNVLGERVISSRPATPSEIIYIGRSPYIDVATGHWMQWDTATSGYIDTGVSAAGRPATFSATATSLPAGSAPTASISGTPDAPVLNLGIPKGDTGATGQRGPTGSAAGFGTPTASVDANVGTPSVSVSASGPNTAKVFNFAFRNLKGQKGDTGGVSSVNGKTGAVQLNDEDIPSSAVAGATTVEEALSQQSQQIGNLTNLETSVKTNLVSAVNEVIDNSAATSTGTISKHSNITSGTLDMTSCFKKGNIVQASGRIYDMVNTISNGVFFVIPEGFRPSSRVYMIGYMNLDEYSDFQAQQRLVIGYIDTDGSVTLTFSYSGHTNQVYFVCTYSI